MDPITAALVLATRFIDLTILLIEKTPDDVTEEQIREWREMCKAIRGFLEKLPKIPPSST